MQKASLDPCGDICPDVTLVFLTSLHDEHGLVFLLALDDLLRHYPQFSDVDFAS